MSDPNQSAVGTRADTVREILSAMSRGEVDLLYASLADDFVQHITGGHRYSGLYQGRDTLLELLKGVRSNFDEQGLVYEVSRVLEAGDAVVVTFTGKGKLKGGADYRNDYCEIWDFRGNEVVRITEFFDSDYVCRAMQPT